MKCIILAGGRGTRLVPLTDKKPKPLIEIGNIPILYHIINRFIEQGIVEFIIAGGYRVDMIQKYVEKHPIKGVSIQVVDTGLESKTGDRLRFLKLQDEPYIVTYGDDISNVKIKEVHRVHKMFGADITMTAGRVRSPWGHLKTDGASFVYDLVEKPILDNYINIGNWIVSGKETHKIKEGETLEEWGRRMVDNPNKDVCFYKYDGFFCGMNTYADFIYLNDLWNKNKNWKKS